MCQMFIFLLHLVFIVSIRSHTQGTVTADRFNFDRLLEKFDVILAKFDDKFPFGDDHDHFKRLSTSIGGAKNFLIVEILLILGNETENGLLAEKYRVKNTDYPAYRLFFKGKTKPLYYTGSKSEDSIKRYLIQKTNLSFNLPGTLLEMNALSEEFYQAAMNENTTALEILREKAQEIVDGLDYHKDKEIGAVYLKIMERVIKTGISFFKDEEKRIKNLLRGKVSVLKKQELNYRSNILLSFKSFKPILSTHPDSNKPKTINRIDL